MGQKDPIHLVAKRLAILLQEFSTRAGAKEALGEHGISLDGKLMGD